MLIRKSVRNFLNKRGYEIIKQEYAGNKFPNLSDDKDVFYCETGIGNYSLPSYGLDEDAVTAVLSRGKLFEPEVINIAKKYIKKGTAVLDIGANFGQMTIEFSKLAGNGGKIYSFEAQEYVFKFLEKNIKNNHLTNVVPIQKAVWDKEGETLNFLDLELNCGAMYSGNSVTGNSNNTKAVKTITIDSLNIQEKISFMKVDIEGADIFALRGARETIMKNRMPIIFEYTQHMQSDFNSSLHDYIEFARSINYRFHEIVLGINFLILPE